MTFSPESALLLFLVIVAAILAGRALIAIIQILFKCVVRVLIVLAKELKLVVGILAFDAVFLAVCGVALAVVLAICGVALVVVLAICGVALVAVLALGLAKLITLAIQGVDMLITFVYRTVLAFFGRDLQGDPNAERGDGLVPRGEIDLRREVAVKREPASQPQHQTISLTMDNNTYASNPNQTSPMPDAFLYLAVLSFLVMFASYLEVLLVAALLHGPILGARLASDLLLA